MAKTSDRITFTDEIIKITKELPAPNHYKPKKVLPKTLLGKSNRAEGIDYMSDVEFLAKTTPDPISYRPKKEFILQKVSSYVELKKPLKEDPTYMEIRPRKSTKPDVGTYKVLEGVTFVKIRNPKYSIGKSKQIKFTEEV
jgi:hypothetical protein